MFRSLLFEINRHISRNIKSPQKSITRNCSVISYDKDNIIKDDGEDKKPYDTNEVIENDFPDGIMIRSYSEYGFRLTNDVSIIGPIVVFPKSVFHWNVDSVTDISVESLCIFHIVKPRIDTLIIGTGDQQVQPVISRQIMNFIKKYKINVEVHATEQACTIFNYLNSESRMVAAALIPPVIVKYSDDDKAATQCQNRTLFTTDSMSMFHDK